jgi:hypothetical protein
MVAADFVGARENARCNELFELGPAYANILARITGLHSARAHTFASGHGTIPQIRRKVPRAVVSALSSLQQFCRQRTSTLALAGSGLGTVQYRENMP